MTRSLTLFSLLFLVLYSTYAQVPGTLSYQGLLTDANGSPLSGSHSVLFNFYTTATNGTAVFSRGPLTVQTYQGLFTVILGNAQGTNNAGIPNLGSTQYFIGIVPDNQTELSPRVTLTAVPYAFTASALDATATIQGTQITGNNLDGAQIKNAITTATIPAANVTGTISNTQLASGIDASKITTGTMSGARVGSGVSGANISGALTTATVPGSNITGTIPSTVLPATVGFSSGRANGGTLASTIPAALIVLTFDTQVTASSAMNNSSGLFTAPSDGWYQFSGSVAWTATYPIGTAFAYFTQSRSGVPIWDTLFTSQSNSVGTNSPTTGVIRTQSTIVSYLKAGDTMAIRVAQTSGSALSYVMDSGQIYFQGVRIGN